jgi:hypothetical protein
MVVDAWWWVVGGRGRVAGGGLVVFLFLVWNLEHEA